MLIWNKTFSILYPYFLWSTVLSIVNVLTASFVNNHFSLSVLESLPLHPIGPFWFLYALFLIQVISLIVFRVLRLSSWTAVAIGLVMLTASFFVDAYVPHQILFHFIFFAAGAAFAEFVGLSPEISTKFAALCSVLYLGGLAVALPNGLVFSTPALLAAGVVAGLIGPMIIFSVVHRLRLDPLFGFAAPRRYGTHVALLGS